MPRKPAKKRAGFTAADWPAEGDVTETWEGVMFCRVCRSAWCPHCRPDMYRRDRFAAHFRRQHRARG